MFASSKRIFAGKRSLQPEPFCPYLTDENGYLSLRRKLSPATGRPDQPHNVRPLYRDGKKI